MSAKPDCVECGPALTDAEATAAFMATVHAIDAGGGFVGVSHISTKDEHGVELTMFLTNDRARKAIAAFPETLRHAEAIHASAIEAGTGETQSGSTEGESAVAKPDAQKGSQP